MSNRLDPDEARHIDGADLVPNRFAKVISRRQWEVKSEGDYMVHFSHGWFKWRQLVKVWCLLHMQ